MPGSLSVTRSRTKETVQRMNESARRGVVGLACGTALLLSSMAAGWIASPAGLHVARVFNISAYAAKPEAGQTAPVR